MPRCPSLTTVALIAVTLLWPGPASAQPASPPEMAAARELVTVTRAADQLKAVLPILMQQLKPAIVQGRPEVARDFDAMLPAMLELVNARSAALMEDIAAVYARNFTVDEMRQLTAFYRGPVGQKFLDKMPAIMQESMSVGQKFAQTFAGELRERMLEELRRRGHRL